MGRQAGWKTCHYQQDHQQTRYYRYFGTVFLLHVITFEQNFFVLWHSIAKNGLECKERTGLPLRIKSNF